jgi:peptide chain release factor 1
MPGDWCISKPIFIAPIASKITSPVKQSQTVFEVILRVRGKGAERLLSESGGHRHQGYSKDRVHTSTVTVAVLPEQAPVIQFDPKDVKIIRTKDSGKGGQHRNKTESCIVAIHEPTGIQAKAADRKQGQNLTTAMHELERRVREREQASWQERLNTLRQQLIGSGERGDKIRTYRERDDVVIDHRTGQKMRFREVVNGNIPHSQGRGRGGR